MEIINNSIRELKRALDIAHVRNRVIAENIANADTPQYKGNKVDFQKAMTDAESFSSINMVKTNPLHVVPGAGDVGVRVDNLDSPVRADGNNVDQNIEMSKLSENTIIYNTAAEILRRKIQLLKFVIEEGR